MTSRLRILHVFRAPVGGLFRHVQDLARAQIAAGHQVGILCDSLTGGANADAALADLARAGLSLTLERLAMQRAPHVSDLARQWRISRAISALAPDVVHGHGSKGALYARLGRRLGIAQPGITAYTPHGGSLNYEPGSLRHRLFMQVERFLEPSTDLFLFESAFIADRYRDFVTNTQKTQRIVLNGLHPHEYVPRILDGDASDLLFIGELRPAKGIDVLIEALARLRARGVAPTLTIVGTGPSDAALRGQVAQSQLGDQVRFVGAMRAADAFRRGRVMVVPSRFESMPYVVLEAVAAAVPLISTRVGGVPEILTDAVDAMIVPDDVDALAHAIAGRLARPPAQAAAQAAALSAAIRPRFSVAAMAEGVEAGYRAAQAARARP